MGYERPGDLVRCREGMPRAYPAVMLAAALLRVVLACTGVSQAALRWADDRGGAV